MQNPDDILSIENLTIHYETDEGSVHALNEVSLAMKRGETLGLVGETGAGKTTLARGILRLVPSPPGVIKQGSVFFEGQDLLSLNESKMRSIRGSRISMIFQDPMTSLNPVMTVGEQIQEVVEVHNRDLKREEIVRQADAMLEMVGIPSERSHEFPHQFSGGMKQRVIIAIALACNPVLLIADEPTTALDVTIQAQVLDMITALKKRLNTAMLLITHDLGVVAQNCDRVAIMYAGQIIELGNLDDIFKQPTHPYTKGLLGSIPSLTKDVKRLSPIKGLMPDPTDLPPGCKFAPRCRFVTEACERAMPDATHLSETHQVRCILAEAEVRNG
ncbi:ABC transporter ATP-binding protein [uncultured Sphaerochaeta sp.]|uniref:ABC transporter ATP-binding protein n=1 Tax=uncultured Sphaerochaeta sp. TaxID=886478 RepID=UPI0029C9EA31|nr:ABC transporter ATP-binding protein [uncultured Sphaerochaeta sp.]